MAKQKKQTKNKCSECYVMVKKYTPIRGIFLTIILTFIMMVPILNLYICTIIYEDGKKEKEDFWEDCFYNYKKIYVKNIKG